MLRRIKWELEVVREYQRLLELKIMSFTYPNIWAQPIFNHCIIFIPYVVNLVFVKKSSGPDLDNSLFLWNFFNLLVISSKGILIAILKLLWLSFPLIDSFNSFLISHWNEWDILLNQVLKDRSSGGQIFLFHEIINEISSNDNVSESSEFWI